MVASYEMERDTDEDVAKQLRNKVLCESTTVDPHISEGNGTDPTSYILKIRI